jgi:hypothetical protein
VESSRSVNRQSVTKVNSIRFFVLGERPSRSRSLDPKPMLPDWKAIFGSRESRQQVVDPWRIKSVYQRKPGSDTEGGWRGNGGKDERAKLGTASRDKTVFMLTGAEEAAGGSSEGP